MSPYASWYVGMKVVCVNWNGSRFSLKHRPSDANMPRIGGVFTIRSISRYGDVVLVRLVEVWNDHLGFKNEPGFNAGGFRPVETRKTDISIFRAMLTPKEVEPA